ncbi:hypothetical protein GGS26DRAFT_251913 [Hypomontagnella submonticulosa]|nr:hypothetical protein GGS26DRAFT_251913 [Hypomontagnella submonticulosa]
MIAIEASMVLWIQTCLLVVTPFFHKLMPWLFRVQKHGNNEPGYFMHGAQEMVSRRLIVDDIILTGDKQPNLPRDGSTIPAGTQGYSSDIPVIAAPRPIHRAPQVSDMKLENYLRAQQAGTPRPLAGSLKIQTKPVEHRAAPFDELSRMTDELIGTHTADSAHGLYDSRNVSPVSSIDRSEPVQPVSPLTIGSSVSMGDRRQQAGVVNPWDTASLTRSETRIGR